MKDIHLMVELKSSLSAKKSYKDNDFAHFNLVFCFLHSQVNKFGAADPNYMMPYMGTFYFNNSNYVNLDNTTLKEYIRKQM